MPTVMQWVNHLLGRIENQKRYAEPYERRYCNEHVLPFIAREYREVYGSAVDLLLASSHETAAGFASGALAPPRTGTAAIGVDALVERLTVLGATSDDARAAKLVQEAWEDNDLDVMHREAHREALVKSRAFATAAMAADNERAVVGIESPEQMAVHRQQAPPYDVDAALKVWVDEWTADRRGLLRLPGRELDLVEGPGPVPDPEGSDVISRWMVDDDRDVPLDVVPVVEFACRPRLLKPPISEIDPVASLVDIVDLIEGLMVFAGHFGAVPIRWGTGLTVPRDPKDPSQPLLGPDGKPAIGFKPRADHFWYNSSPDGKFGQLEPAGLASFVAWANHASSRVRAKTQIASTYYSLDLKSHMSAELLKTDEAPMVRRLFAMGRDGGFGQSWRQVQRLILALEDPTSRARVRPRWADPETRVEAQATDSFQKVVASGVDVAVAAEQFLGWEPELVARAVAAAATQTQPDPAADTLPLAAA